MTLGIILGIIYLVLSGTAALCSLIRGNGWTSLVWIFNSMVYCGLYISVLLK